MQLELQNKLFEKYPKIFIQKDLPMSKTCMCWGITCGDGWFWLIERLCDCIQSHLDNNLYIYMRKRNWLGMILFFLSYNNYIIVRFGSSIKKIKREQIEAIQVKEKFGCYDKETEVLTKKGWKFFKDILKSDEIMVLKNNQFIDYEKPSDIIKYKYKGKMYSLKSSGIDLVVTPNHNLYVSKSSYVNGRKNNFKRNYPFELTTYQKYFHKNKRFLKSGTWYGKEEKSITIPGYSYSNFMKIRNKTRYYVKKPIKFSIDKFLNFLGWFVSEGCANEKKGEISISFCNIGTKGIQEKILIGNAIKNLGLKLKTSMEDRTAGVFKIYNKQLAEWLTKNCGKHSSNKKVPNFIKNLPPKQIEIFLRSLFLGDGHKNKTSHHLYTVSKTLSNDVQELIIKCGKGFSFYIAKPKTNIYKNQFIIGKYPCFCINRLKSKECHTQSKKGAKNFFEGLIDYNDYVYCVEVPSHIIYVRRNGKGYWCGNSLRFYTNDSCNMIEGMVHLAEHMSASICEDCGSTENVTQTKGWIYTRCPECLKKLQEKREIVGASNTLFATQSVAPSVSATPSAKPSDSATQSVTPSASATHSSDYK